MRTISPEGMRALEALAIEEIGIPSFVLMEKAAAHIAEAVWSYAPGGRVLFLCGPGNNGGDGLAAARLHALRGGSSDVWLTGEVAALKGDAKRNAEILQKLHIELREMGSMDATDACIALEWALAQSQAAVDALFGIGLDREPEGIFRGCIEALNHCEKPIVSVDVPSGIDSATGHVYGEAVRAACTVTFGHVKTGMLLLPARKSCGKLLCCDIGLPGKEGLPDGAHVLSAQEARWLLPRRPMDAHKGENGHALIIAGSRGMAGAAALCAQAALRGGAGLVTLACPSAIVDTVQTLAPSAMCWPLSATQHGNIAPGCRPALSEALVGKSAVAIGPGLRTGDGVAQALAEVASKGLPTVVDADALNRLAMDSAPFVGPNTLTPLRGKAVLTPHPGEMARLCECSVPDVLAAPLECAQRLAERVGAVVLLKGATTCVASPWGDTALNINGTPGMATGGSGDVLTGLITALLAQGLAPFDAARIGACLHADAGERAAARLGVLGMTAEDIVADLPAALMESAAV